ncbi:MAG: TIR domain-containing protein [Ruminococcaceae bacterium]|nr:TIR domain-containing protein [Oscillospiraceae bacterium]
MSEQNIAVLQCAGCTAPLDEKIANTGVYRCKFCGYTNILPKKEQTSEVIHYLRSGDEGLNDTDFERAYNAYEKAAELDPKESKAHFGMALAANKVKYIKDVVNDRWQAICCQVSEKKFSSDPHLAKAIKLATPEQKKEYAARASEIDYIREKFVELQKTGLIYDTFICVKVSDGNGGYTQDSVWAGKLYDSIKKSGLNPFYSEREIGDRVGEDYEALILYALHTSKSMIVVCSHEEYLRTPWVRNEYTRYYSMMTDNEKQSNSIMIAFDQDVIERIPGIPGKIQGVEFHSFDASQKITDFVSKFANAKERARKEAEERAKREEERKAKEEAELKAREEQRQMLEELQRKLAETEEKVQSKDAENKAKEESESSAQNKILEEQRKMLEELQKKLAATEEKVQNQSRAIKAQADDAKKNQQASYNNTGSYNASSYNSYSDDSEVSKQLTFAKVRKGKKALRITFSIIKWVLLTIFSFIASSNMYMEGAFFLALFIGATLSFLPSIFGRGALRADPSNSGKVKRRRVTAIVFSIISLVFSSLLTIIFLIAEIDGAPAMCLSGAVIDILVLIFMKIADKKGYIYIPNYSL